MRAYSLRLALVATAVGSSWPAAATDALSPVGLWKTFNDDKQETSLVRISESAGVLTGKVEKILFGDSNVTCKECPDDDPRKDKPVLGMTILKDLRKSGDGFDGGTILSPGKGKIFKAELKLVEGGRKLEMKGKFGPFGKTSVWQRIE